MAKKKGGEMSFDADVAQLIHLVTHSIYSNKEVFLRELIANANDALQKAKINAAKDASYLGEQTDLTITVSSDQEKGTITIEDTGIGMNHDQAIENLGTIAKSGTKAFLQQMKESKEKGSAEMIGQFGIGFYSAFMVASEVSVESKTAGDDAAVLWKSTGGGSYEIAESKKKTRGTTIILHLNDADKEFASPSKLKGLIIKHANYVPVPIMMHEIGEDDKPTKKLEQVNEMKSLWSKQKSEVSKEDYQKFYQTLTFDSEAPLDTIHLHIEGMLNFKALLYIPKNPPIFGHIDAEKEYGPSLYVQNVLIMDNAKELLPVWLRFIKGVVETPDLSLNVSRELIQSNQLLAKIQKTLVKEVLKSLNWALLNERADYNEFYKNYNRYLKEGVHYDREHKEEITKNLLFHSWKKNSEITFDEYIEAMKKDEKASESNKKTDKDDAGGEGDDEEKEAILYLTGSSIKQLQGSPYLEQFEETDTDVFLMSDPIDERVVQALSTYKEHPVRSATHAERSEGDSSDTKKKETEEKTAENKNLLGYIMSSVGEDKLEKVVLSHKLKNSLAMLVMKEGQTSAQMERIMEAMGQDVVKGKRILELNADHPLVQKMITEYNSDEKSEFVQELGLYAYEQALLLEGGAIEDMNEFLRRANKLIAGN